MLSVFYFSDYKLQTLDVVISLEIRQGSCVNYQEILYSRKLSMEKIIFEFRCFVPISESFFHDCLKAQLTVGSTNEQSTKYFSVKFHFFLQSAKVFSLKRFPLYGTTNVHMYTNC